MMRAKRPRSTPAATAAAGHGGHRARAMSDDTTTTDDHLLHMDPSLMTERQQLAFLLRATAHEQSHSDSTGNSSASSDEDAPTSKRPKQRVQRPKISPRSTSESDENQAKRGRARKASPKTAVAEEASKATPRSARPDRAPVAGKSDKQLRVKTSASALESDERYASTLSVVKPSPSSTSDIAHVSVFDEHTSQGDFWSMHCALCSQASSPVGTAPEPLFLCAACDAKYPTQRALGLV